MGAHNVILYIVFFCLAPHQVPELVLRSISSVGLERGANNAKVLGSTPILTISLILLLLVV